jgi:hypothetical protein
MVKFAGQLKHTRYRGGKSALTGKHLVSAETA